MELVGGGEGGNGQRQSWVEAEAERRHAHTIHDVVNTVREEAWQESLKAKPNLAAGCRECPIKQRRIQELEVELGRAIGKLRAAEDAQGQMAR